MYNDGRLKKDSDFGGMFQHDQAMAHMATETRELLEEYNINFIEWPRANLSPTKVYFGEIQLRTKEH
jgi:hypothetical protein